MGRKIENPRYNVLSFRASDEERAIIEAAINGGSRQSFLLEAALEKILRDEQFSFKRGLKHGL